MSTTEQKLTRTLTPEVRIIDASLGIAEFVASDETLDHYSEVIKASGWKFTWFAKNAPFVDSHDYSSIEKLLGRVIDSRIEGRQLIQRVKYAIDVPSCVLAGLAFGLVEKGYLKAVSVGFVPTSYASRYGDPKAWNDAVTAIGMTPENAANCERIFLEQEQLELSQCVIGANPNALAKAFKDGALKEEQMRTLGYGDAASMDFLNQAAASWDTAPPVLRSMIALQMRTQFAQGKLNSKSGSSAGSRDDAEDPQHRAQSRADFLKQLQSAITPAK